MLLHRWPVRALPLGKARPSRALVWATGLMVAATLAGVEATPADPGKSKSGPGAVDTEDVFGFTEGSDIGEAGDLELEADSIGRFGKRDGSYNALSTTFEAKYTAIENFRITPSATITSFDIAGVTGIGDRIEGAFQGLAVDLRFRLLRREWAPFGLTFSVEPHWGRRDGTSGAPADQQGLDFRFWPTRRSCPVGSLPASTCFMRPSAHACIRTQRRSRSPRSALPRRSRRECSPVSFLAARRGICAIMMALGSIALPETRCIWGRRSTPGSAGHGGCRQRGTVRWRAAPAAPAARSIWRTSSAIRRGCGSVSISECAARVLRRMG